VVAGHAEERHAQPGDDRVELRPLRVELGGILRAALDQVADAHHERRRDQVERVDRAFEHAGAVTAGAIGDDREREVARVVLGREPGPRLRRTRVVDLDPRRSRAAERAGQRERGCARERQPSQSTGSWTAAAISADTRPRCPMRASAPCRAAW
jgi:hypothetical protein